MTEQTEREKLRDAIAMAICMASCGMVAHRSDYMADADAALLAIEAAGARVVPVDEKPGQGWLHEAVKDACLRVSKNSGGTPPQLLYAPILWAMQDALAASPYAPQKDESHE